MKLITLSAFTILVFCLSCNQSPSVSHLPKKQDIPKPLRDDSKDVSFISKRGPDNLVEEIYSDLVKDHSDLKNLESQRDHFSRGKSDSLEAFENYNSKSDSYYHSAFETLNNIQDTVLRQRLRVLLANSQKRYGEEMSKVMSLIKKMKIEELSTTDYYLTLKIASTMPVMEEYQDNNLAFKKSVEAIASESGKLNLSTKQLAEKYQDKIISNK